LAGKGFNTQIRLAQARSALETARSALDRAETQLAQTEIRAPIAGILDRRPIETGNLVRPGDEVARLVDLTEIKVVGYVTERQVTHIDEGAEAEIAFLEGPTRRGSVTFVAASADPQTRTFRVEATVPNPQRSLIDGLTARMEIPLDAQRAHKVPLSALTLDDDGNIGIKAVGGDDRVVFMPVEILSDTQDGVWLAGLPETLTLITVGQEFVTPGQKVEPVYQPPPSRDPAKVSAEGPS
jgi:multidrug efflux system membrane fusion protein